MIQLPKELLELFEQRLGKRAGAFLVILTFSALVCLLLGIIGGTISVTYTKLVTPLLHKLPAMNVQEYNNALIAILVTILLLVATGAVVFRAFNNLKTAMFTALENSFTGWNRQIDSIAEMQQNILMLKESVTKLEQHTDISGTRQRLVKELMVRDPPIRIKIRSAEYGAKDKWLNVTKTVRIPPIVISPSTPS
jgi:uncharacterized membrane protein